MTSTPNNTEAELLEKLSGYAATIVATGIVSPGITAQVFVSTGAVIGERVFGGIQMAEFLRDLADNLERKHLAAGG